MDEEEEENQIVDETIEVIKGIILDFSPQAKDAAEAIRNRKDVLENIRVIRDQVELIDIHDLRRLLLNGRKDSKIKGKGAIVFIGLSKAGKTTLTTALMGYPMCRKQIKGLDTIQSAIKLRD